MNATVLVVEDSPTQAMHIQDLLEGVGVRVVLAGDGLEGIGLAQRVHPDLIVLDMQLPEMNGFQVCERLKARRETQRIPVVLFTRHDDPEMVTLGKQTGALDYIPKDAFADAVLIETMRQMGLLEPCTA